jgi:glyoxalase family protein
MTRLLDYTVVGEMDSRIRLAVNGGGPGKTIDVAHHADAEPAVNGLGTVHHVAMAVGSAEEQLRLRGELLQYGCKVTEVRDRCYFQSIYFREPGGVLFEIATDQPGFTIDEPLADLGMALKLPAFLEPRRQELEAVLPSLELAA